MSAKRLEKWREWREIANEGRHDSFIDLKIN